MAQKILNIIRLHAVNPADLAAVCIVPGRGAYVIGSQLPTTEIALDAPAELRDSTKTVDRTKVHTVQLTAKISERIMTDGYPLCYIATSVDGSQWLVGSFDQPFPVSDIEDVMPSRFTDRSGCNLTVQWSGTVGLLRVKHQPTL